MADNREVRLGIVGYGNMGTTHARLIAQGLVPGMVLTAVSASNPQRQAACRENHPGVAVFDTPEALYTSGLCDAVLIATPHYSHAELAVKAFEAGLHVMVEKPAGVYTLQAEKMNAAAASSGKVFGIMYNQRTNPVYGRLRRMVQSGELGQIKRITWIITDWYRSQAYHDSSAWRSTWKGEGGGCLINQNPHQLDIWQWIFGMPDKVFAKISFGKYYDIEVEDDVMAHFEYESGTTGQYITSTGEAPGTNRLEIACDMGRVVVENNTITFDRNVVSERQFNRENANPFGRPECVRKVITVEGAGEQHVGILKSFTNAILYGEELLAGGEDGLRGLTLSNAMVLSAWTGETVDVKHFPGNRFYGLLQEKIAASTVTKTVRKVTVDDISGTYK